MGSSAGRPSVERQASVHKPPGHKRDAHYRFLLSGADVITTATYQASVSGFMNHLDVSCDRAKELMMSGVHLAKETVEKFVSDTHPTGRRRPLVAGSVGPYGAFLLDGSEYTGSYAEKMSEEDFKVWHRPQIECIAAAGADFVAFETIPSLKEAKALVDLLREFPDVKAWLSFSCKAVIGSDQLVAVGVNCCPPALLQPLLDSAASLGTDPCWVVYPNSGEDWDSEHGWRTSKTASSSIPKLSHTWRKQGAALIGGCCRVGPDEIAELRRELKGSSTTVE
ncbi:Homocysteine S-methyltransferase 1 [Dissostichus eleginoides]|uniref:Homocysteine S-methyltransferase 1 n=1 Tax=Dissostichus eleginoides TaxID=100907 RepID=A0AAD9FD06_DISEL|nr:Homocysteine S-methyltransferase 1 [Dissostichus eleginoides]